jgi:hypothetical protein
VGILQRAKATSANHYGSAGVTVESSDEFSGGSDSDAAGCNEVWVYSLCVEYVVLCRERADPFSESGSNIGDECSGGSGNWVVSGNGDAVGSDSSSEHGDVSSSERTEGNVVLCSENALSRKKAKSRRSRKTRTQCRELQRWKLQRRIPRSRIPESRFCRSWRQGVRKAEDSISGERRQTSDLSETTSFSELHGRWK